MSRNEISAGGVVYRKKNNEYEVLVSKHSGYHKWVIPKGRVEKDETIEATALREVEEEVGVKAKVIASIGEPEEYIYTLNGEKIFKKVHYFLMEYISGSEKDHDFEMEEVLWVPMDKGIELMAYDGAKQVLREARLMLNK